MKKMFRFNMALSFHTSGEAVGPCPICKAGTDRFIVFEEGNFFCRYAARIGKEHKGWWLNQEQRPTPEQLAAKRLVEQQDKIKLMSSMTNCQDWQIYHAEVNEALWLATGIDRAAIDRWGLGYCKQAPCCDYETPSLTIPVFRDQKLVDIRHRLVNPKEGQKYRSHKAGLPAQVFNLDAMNEGEVIYVVEGEKKAIVLEHSGLHPTISYPGVNNVNLISDILLQDTGSKKFIFIPDPQTNNVVIPVLRRLTQEGVRVGLVDLFDKPDDFVLNYGANPLQAALRYPRGF